MQYHFFIFSHLANCSGRCSHARHAKSTSNFLFMRLAPPQIKSDWSFSRWFCQILVIELPWKCYGRFFLCYLCFSFLLGFFSPQLLLCFSPAVQMVVWGRGQPTYTAHLISNPGDRFQRASSFQWLSFHLRFFPSSLLCLLHQFFPLFTG